jgi:hypothetical protein
MNIKPLTVQLGRLDSQLQGQRVASQRQHALFNDSARIDAYVF